MFESGLFHKFTILHEKKPINLLELCLYSVGGAVAGVLPDVLEPATNPNHRSLFHSFTTFSMIIKGNSSIWNESNQTLTKDRKVVISILSAAYCSHLITDSFTTKGLPLLL